MMKRVILSFVCGLSAAQGIAGTMGEVAPVADSYFGAFGGGGKLSSMSVAHLGVDYYPPTAGGIVAANLFGRSKSHSDWLVGGMIGHEFNASDLPYFSRWSIRPAAELEGYYIGKKNVTSNTTNIASTSNKQDFTVTYPMSSGVGMINAILNFDSQQALRWHPYVGGGVGMGVVSISSATAIQTNPAGVTANQYGSSSSASDTAFATQAKAGLNFDYNEHFKIFAEYRYLYLASTSFMFGSPLNTALASNWSVKLGSQSYNLGVAGIKYYL